MGSIHDPTICSVVDYCQTHAIPFQFLCRRQVAEKFVGYIDISEDWMSISNEYAGVIKAMFQTLAYKNGVILVDKAKVVEVEIKKSKSERA